MDETKVINGTSNSCQQQTNAANVADAHVVNATNTAKAKTQSLITRLATRFGVDTNKLLRCLTTQVFKQTDGGTLSNEELMVLLLVCENFGLNPFNREIFAFRGRGGDIVPIVSLDGWCKIVRSQKDFNGMSFRFSESTVKLNGSVGELPEYVECSIRLKGVDASVTIQEYMVECFNDRSNVWKKWPRRMLRSRAFIQCARLAFSLTGLYDEGDAYSEEGFNGRLTLDGIQTTPTIKQETPKMTLNRAELDGMVTKLIAHAQHRENGWERALEWVNTNLTGADKAYAEATLQKQRTLALRATAATASDLDAFTTNSPELTH